MAATAEDLEEDKAQDSGSRLLPQLTTVGPSSVVFINSSHQCYREIIKVCA